MTRIDTAAARPLAALPNTLQAAARATRDADEARKLLGEMITCARNHGHTTGTIAELLGVSPSAVFQWQTWRPPRKSFARWLDEDAEQ